MQNKKKYIIETLVHDTIVYLTVYKNKDVAQR